MIAPMRRWLAILLLVLIPVQATWAAASAYCGHESGVAAKHFGHHEHQHQGDSHNEPTKSPGSVDADCPVCLAGCVTAPPASSLTISSSETTLIQGVLSALVASALPSQPERPNWSISA